MDAKKQVTLTMLEIQEIVYRLEKALKAMEPDAASREPEDAGIHNEKKEMIRQIITKLQS